MCHFISMCFDVCTAIFKEILVVNLKHNFPIVSLSFLSFCEAVVLYIKCSFHFIKQLEMLSSLKSLYLETPSNYKKISYFFTMTGRHQLKRKNKQHILHLITSTRHTSFSPIFSLLPFYCHICLIVKI